MKILKKGDKVKIKEEYKYIQFNSRVKNNIDKIFTVGIDWDGINLVYLLEVDVYLGSQYLEKIENVEKFKVDYPVEIATKLEGSWVKRFYAGYFNNRHYVKGVDSNDFNLYTYPYIRECKCNEFKEYTMQEIANALKIDIKDLRIKK
jgi:hypothetical protein